MQSLSRFLTPAIALLGLIGLYSQPAGAQTPAPVQPAVAAKAQVEPVMPAPAPKAAPALANPAVAPAPAPTEAAALPKKAGKAHAKPATAKASHARSAKAQKVKAQKAKAHAKKKKAKAKANATALGANGATPKLKVKHKAAHPGVRRAATL
ncbi:MAG: hypothetical protein Fur007_03570 [Rhodoferax sp.]